MKNRRSSLFFFLKKNGLSQKEFCQKINAFAKRKSKKPFSISAINGFVNGGIAGKDFWNALQKAFGLSESEMSNLKPSVPPQMCVFQVKQEDADTIICAETAQFIFNNMRSGNLTFTQVIQTLTTLVPAQPNKRYGYLTRSAGKQDTELKRKE